MTQADNSGTGWAITGVHGLYTGCHQRRCDAIRHHLHCLHGTAEFMFRVALTKEEKRLWKAQRQAGDRAVMVRIEEIEW